MNKEFYEHGNKSMHLKSLLNFAKCIISFTKKQTAQRMHSIIRIKVTSQNSHLRYYIFFRFDYGLEFVFENPSQSICFVSNTNST